MKIALYQCPSNPLEKPANLQRLAAAVKQAADGGADILVTPEMYLSGYDIGADAARKLAEPMAGPSAAALGEIAAKYNIAIVYGYPELYGGTVYNSAQMIGGDGTRLGNYRKNHLYGAIDRELFAPGDGAFPTIDFSGWKLGMLICYDVEFPEMVRMQSLAGVELLLVPTANMVPYDMVSKLLVPARAAENQIFIGYANYCGMENTMTYAGLSCIAGVDGAHLALAGRDETMIFAEFDRKTMMECRKAVPYLANRRADIYGSLCRAGDDKVEEKR